MKNVAKSVESIRDAEKGRKVEFFMKGVADARKEWETETERIKKPLIELLGETEAEEFHQIAVPFLIQFFGKKKHAQALAVLMEWYCLVDCDSKEEMIAGLEGK